MSSKKSKAGNGGWVEVGGWQSRRAKAGGGGGGGGGGSGGSGGSSGSSSDEKPAWKKAIPLSEEVDEPTCENLSPEEEASKQKEEEVLDEEVDAAVAEAVSASTPPVQIQRSSPLLDDDKGPRIIKSVTPAVRPAPALTPKSCRIDAPQPSPFATFTKGQNVLRTQSLPLGPRQSPFVVPSPDMQSEAFLTATPQVGAWADDVPTPLSTRLTPPLSMIPNRQSPGFSYSIPPSSMGIPQGGVPFHAGMASIFQEQMRAMGMVDASMVPQMDMGGSGEMVRLQVDPRTTLDVPKSHLRLTQRAEAHLRNNGHVGWCQRHHNTGNCGFGASCAFAHVIDKLVDQYRKLAEQACSANQYNNMRRAQFQQQQQMGMGMAASQMPMQSGPARTGRPSPLAGLSGGGMMGSSSAAAVQNQDRPVLKWQKHENNSNSTAASTSSPSQPPAAPTIRSTGGSSSKYWSTNRPMDVADSNTMSTLEIIKEATGALLRTNPNDPEFSAVLMEAYEYAATELPPTASWQMISSWLRKQSWGSAAAIAIDLCVAAGLQNHSTDMLIGRVNRMLRTSVGGRLRLIDVSLTHQEAVRQPSQMDDVGGTELARMMRINRADLTEVEAVCLNFHKLGEMGLKDIARSLPNHVGQVDLLWLDSDDKYQGVAEVVSKVQSLTQGCIVRVSAKGDEDVATLAELLGRVVDDPMSSLTEVQVIFRGDSPLSFAGRQQLRKLSGPSLLCTTPAIFLPPVPQDDVPDATEIRVVCYEITADEVKASSAFLHTTKSNVKRVLFRGITKDTAPLLGFAVQAALSRPSVTTLDLQMAKDTKERKEGAQAALAAFLPIFTAKAKEAASSTSVKHLLFETKDVPSTELLDACLILPIEKLHITTYADRQQVEQGLPRLLKHLKMVAPAHLQMLYIDYGRGYGREHGVLRTTAPYEMSRVEWMKEEEADDIARAVLELPPGSNERNVTPSRFAPARMVAEVFGMPLAEPAAPNAVRTTTAEEFLEELNRRGTPDFRNVEELNLMIIQNTAGTPMNMCGPLRPSITLHPSVDKNFIDLSKHMSLRILGCEFVNCTLKLGTAQLGQCLLRGCTVIVENGVIQSCTLVGTVLKTVNINAAINCNRVVAEDEESANLPMISQSNLVLLIGRAINVMRQETMMYNQFVPVPLQANWYPEPRQDTPRGRQQVPVIHNITDIEATSRIVRLFETFTRLHSRGAAVTKPAGFGCSRDGMWVVYDFYGTALTQNPPMRWFMESNVMQITAGVRDVLSSLHRENIVHARVTADNIFYIRDRSRWVLGPPAVSSEMMTPRHDQECVDAILGWISQVCQSVGYR
eukprot:Sspe_Gene.21896::Locus_8248_Transcript_2_5_Confidence_0.273_Length_4297::g.21896::m.21896